MALAGEVGLGRGWGIPTFDFRLQVRDAASLDLGQVLAESS